MNEDIEKKLMTNRIHFLENKIEKMTNLMLNHGVSKYFESMQTRLNNLHIQINEIEKKRLEDQEKWFSERLEWKKKAYFYESLMGLVKENPVLEDEWVRFRTLIKLCCDQGSLEKLGDEI